MCWLVDDDRRRDALGEDPLSPGEQENRPLEVRIGVKQDVWSAGEPIDFERKQSDCRKGDGVVLEVNCGYKCDL